MQQGCTVQGCFYVISLCNIAKKSRRHPRIRITNEREVSMFGGIKYQINRLQDMAFRRYISHYIVQAMQLNTQRNKVITCDFILEADTSPQDEFELFKYIYEQHNE